jgi:hypothetical protein
MSNNDNATILNKDDYLTSSDILVDYSPVSPTGIGDDEIFEGVQRAVMRVFDEIFSSRYLVPTFGSVFTYTVLTGNDSINDKYLTDTAKYRDAVVSRRFLFNPNASSRYEALREQSGIYEHILKRLESKFHRKEYLVQHPWEVRTARFIEPQRMINATWSEPHGIPILEIPRVKKPAWDKSNDLVGDIELKEVYL